MINVWVIIVVSWIMPLLLSWDHWTELSSSLFFSSLNCFLETFHFQTNFQITDIRCSCQVVLRTPECGQCDKQSSCQFHIWWKNFRVENLLLWCQKIFCPQCVQTWAQWGTFKVIMGRWWGLLCSRQVKDKLKGNLSELSTMIGWHESGLQHSVTWLEYSDCQATGLGYSLSSPALITPPVFTLGFCLNSWVLTLCFKTSK